MFRSWLRLQLLVYEKYKKRENNMRFISSVILPCTIIIMSIFFISEISVAVDSSSVGQVQDNAKRLIGAWQRQDGNYTIDIHEILKEGGLGAAYYNPKPINVSRAMYMERDGILNIFIELRDTGYPGSTYTLTYSSKNDSLAGVYFHAGLNRTFDVIFLRKKD